jgi:hypothetical protein
MRRAATEEAMRFSLSSLLRLGLLAVLLSSAAALGLARIVPAPKGWRMLRPVAYTSINSFCLDPCSRGSVWIDRDGATIGGSRRGDDELIEYASFSPWCDENGRCQVVSRWSWGLQGESSEGSYGLARVTYPAGEVLDHVETDVVPVSYPCWYPGTRARVLFAAGDGKLYQCAFEPAEGPDGPADGTEGRPRELVWDCPLPCEDGVYLTDPCWPSDPRMRNILFVGLRCTPGPSRGGVGPTQIWWLRLSDEGGSIEEAGQLLGGPTDSPAVVERCPVLGRSPAGGSLLAYFRGTKGQPMGLHVVQIEMDPGQDCPRAVAGSDATLAENCLASPPVFSSDRRWLSIVQLAEGGRGLRRIPLGGNAAAPAVAALAHATRPNAATYQ